MQKLPFLLLYQAYASSILTLTPPFSIRKLHSICIYYQQGSFIPFASYLHSISGCCCLESCCPCQSWAPSCWSCCVATFNIIFFLTNIQLPSSSLLTLQHFLSSSNTSSCSPFASVHHHHLCNSTPNSTISFFLTQAGRVFAYFINQQLYQLLPF